VLTEVELSRVLEHLPGWARWPAGSARLVALEFLGALRKAGWQLIFVDPKETRPASPSVEQTGAALALGRKR